MKMDTHDTFGDFKCIHCRTIVSADIRFSGVNNRNHCPYCLWSKHLDLNHSGDRLCACKGAMQPIGLTVKQANKKYASKLACEKQGELMIIHRCSDCERLSINRIAADDIAENVLDIFNYSHRLDAGTRENIMQAGIRLLTSADSELVYARLFGWRGAEYARQPAMFDTALAD